MSMQRVTTFITAISLVLSFALGVPEVAEASDDNAKVEAAFELFWAKRRSIKAYENQKFRKDGKWEVSINSGVVPNDDFYLFVPAGLSATYFLSEVFGVELEGAYFVTLKSDLAQFLEIDGSNPSVPRVLGKLPKHEKQVFRATVNALWSPIHGKLGFLTSKLFHYDIHLTGGFGTIGTQVMDIDPENQDQILGGAVTPTFTGQLGLGFRFWLNKDMAIRAGYRQYFDMSQLGDLILPAEIAVGFSYFTGGVN